MGYALVYESMMESVLFARDKWLNKESGSQQKKNTVTMETKSLQVLKSSDEHGLCQKIKFVSKAAIIWLA